MVGASLNCATLRLGASRVITRGRTPMSPAARVTTEYRGSARAGRATTTRVPE
jgi:hypothetical protein